MVEKGRRWDDSDPGRQVGQDHDQAHCLVHDHGLQRKEPEHADKQRKPELCPAKTDQSPEDTNSSAS
jgi:hypothetical protein